MPQKYLQFSGNRMMGSPKLWEYFTLGTKQKKIWGKNPPKHLPSRQKEQFSPKEAAPGHPPRTGCGEGSPSSCRNIWIHSLDPEGILEARTELERRCWKGGRLQLPVLLQRFPPGPLSLLKEHESVFSSVIFSSTPCATPPPSVDTDLKIFKLKNNIIMLLSCSLCLYLEAFRGNF